MSHLIGASQVAEGIGEGGFDVDGRAKMKKTSTHQQIHSRAGQGRAEQKEGKQVLTRKG